MSIYLCITAHRKYGGCYGLGHSAEEARRSARKHGAWALDRFETYRMPSSVEWFDQVEVNTVTGDFSWPTPREYERPQLVARRAKYGGKILRKEIERELREGWDY